MCAAAMSGAGAVPPRRRGAQERLRALQSGIIELILERELEPGDPLPTENELTGVLGVGRNTLREALKVLQAVGVIEIRHGFGTFVAASNFDALVEGLLFRARLSLRHQGREALELIDARRLLESGLVGTAIAALQPGKLAGLEAAVLRIEELARSGEPFVEAAADFHHLLFEPLGNAQLQGLLGAFRTVGRRIELERSVAGVDRPGDAVRYRQLYQAVAAGDADLAAELLGSHFGAIRRRVEAAAED